MPICPTARRSTAALERMQNRAPAGSATIRAQGLKEAQIIRADAQAEAAQIYAAAFNKDPKFYDFYRAMQSYRTPSLRTPRPSQGRDLDHPDARTTVSEAVRWGRR